MVLTSFYLISMAILLVGLSLAVLAKKSELINRGIVLIAFVSVMTLAIYLGQWAFNTVMLIVAVVGAFELASCCGMKRVHSIALGLCSAGIFWAASFDIALIVSLIIIGIAGMNFNKTLLPWFATLGVVAPCSAALVNIFYTQPNHVIAIIFLVQFNDAISYMVGKLLGKTKLPAINKLSPNKTLEGYVGGLLGVVLAEVTLHTTIKVYSSTNVWLNGALIMAVIFIFANAGDLLFSFIKRKIGVKDFSRLLGQHGGMLDRFDSILLVSPFYLLLLHFVMT